ncbi:hypothetical protein Lalb_Chr01g0017571 [Lupinus albus]|uniref:Uncharacterized protein n=1 Tax=Lupinus albus TaxID=3870 RepID=A0A6A4R930_LUPAL|nr:hypothetical protein Lalb_Chr01g0017571 [Lupinus albus]
MDAITNFDLGSYEVKAIIESNSRPPTMKKVPTHSDILMNKVTSEVLSSSSNTFFLSQPLNLQLKNSPISIFHGNNQNPSSSKLSGTASEAGTSENATIGDNICTTLNQNLLKKRSYTETSASSSSNILNEQTLTKQMRTSSNNFSGGLIGTISKEATNGNSIGNFGAMFSNQGTNVEQPLTQHNSSSFSLHGSQNLDFMQCNSSSFGGFTRTSSQAATKDNSIGNYGAMFANHSGNVEQSMLLRSGQVFQEETQDQQNQFNVNINNEFSHDLFINNNQYFQHNPSLSIDDFSLPDFPSDFEVQLSPLQGIVLHDFDAPQEQIQSDVEINNDSHDLLLNNQPFPLNPSPTLVNHDTQNLGFQNDIITSNFPNDNSSKSSFFSSFLNLCSETNTTSLSQVLQDLDDLDLFSNDSFQNPSYETNAASQDGLDLGQCVTNLDNVYQNPISETNTGSQVQIGRSQNDLDISDYLSDSYAVGEE